MATYLDEIVAAHREADRDDARPLGPLLQRAEEHAASHVGRDVVGALRGAPGVAVIAEIKRRSPSRGDLAPDLDPASLARQYEAGGAACLSVLTDARFFGGSPADLRAARAAVGLPVLRKDFTVGPRDVCDARLMGADAVLLIAAVLEDRLLADLVALAGRLDLAALVEVHDAAELGRALAAGATLVGVNQRDLRTFAVDRDLAARLAPSFPPDVVAVAESGIRDAADAARLAAAGYRALLLGESVVTSADPRGAVAALAATTVAA